MSKDFTSFLTHIKGKWLSHENFYYLLNKKVKTYEGKTNFLIDDKRNYLCESRKKDEKPLTYVHFTNSYQNEEFTFQIESKTPDILFSNLIEKNKDLYYKEHIYNSSKNVVISFGILKDIVQNKYLGLKVSSYIRII